MTIREQINQLTGAAGGEVARTQDQFDKLQERLAAAFAFAENAASALDEEVVKTTALAESLRKVVAERDRLREDRDIAVADRERLTKQLQQAESRIIQQDARISTLEQDQARPEYVANVAAQKRLKAEELKSAAAKADAEATAAEKAAKKV